MVFGADLTHEMDKPSVACMVASMHQASIVYEEAISVQGLVEPSSTVPRTLLPSLLSPRIAFSALDIVFSCLLLVPNPD